MPADERVPVVVAVGQSIERSEKVGALDMAARAAQAALDTAPGLGDAVDRVVFVNSFSPAGKAPASDLAEHLGLKAVEVCQTTTVGGNTPQWLVNTAAGDIAAGNGRTSLIVGGEAQKSGGRSWGSRGDDDEATDVAADEVIGSDELGFIQPELQAGLLVPARVYPLLESAAAFTAGRDAAAQRAWLGEFMAPFTTVAAGNPYAWFAEAASPADLSTVTDANRLTTEPYTKRMNAFLGGDQGAAVIVTDLATAKRLGLADQCIFIWGGGDARDLLATSQRPSLGQSPGIKASAGGALAAAGVGADDLALIDFYSCFPIAVQCAVDALGLSFDDSRGFTVTGGLPYMGGPGNNYTTHGIATMVDRLRGLGGASLGLCTGLGWYVTKHSAGVYGTTPPPGGFARADNTAAQAAIEASAIPVDEAYTGPAVVDGSSVVYDRDGSVKMAPLYARTPGGQRVAAAFGGPADDLQALAGRFVVGETVQITAPEGPQTWTW